MTLLVIGLLALSYAGETFNYKSQPVISFYVK